MNKDNFFKASRARFISCNRPNCAPDYISFKRIYGTCLPIKSYDYEDMNNYIADAKEYIRKEYHTNVLSVECIDDERGIYVFTLNQISSSYWYTDEGVIRYSDHWGKARSCFWFLDNNFDLKIEKKAYAFCRWNSFVDITYDIFISERDVYNAYEYIIDRIRKAESLRIRKAFFEKGVRIFQNNRGLEIKMSII